MIAADKKTLDHDPAYASKGFLRRKAITGPNGLIPISPANLYKKIKKGEFPPPVKFGRISLWRAEDIAQLITKLGEQGGDNGK